MKGTLLGTALCLCAAGANASTTGPNDFGPSAIVQTFNQLPVEGGANQSSFLLDGITYAFSPGSFDITNSHCLSGNCIENSAENAEWTITLGTPAFRVGGYLDGAGFTVSGSTITLYDSTQVTILGVISPVSIDQSLSTGFFGFESDGALISFVRINPNGTVFATTLDNFTVETTPIPTALPLFATGLGALGLIRWRRKRKAAALAA